MSLFDHKRASSSHTGKARWLIPWALIGALLGGVFGIVRPTTVTATSALYVSAAKPESGVDQNQLTSTVLARMLSYYNFTQSDTVLQPVIDKLKLDTTVNELRSSIRASVPADSMVIEVSATSDSAEEAATIANAVRDSLSNAIEQMTPDQSGGTPSIEVFRYRDAAQWFNVSKPNSMVYGVLGAILGTLTALAITGTWNRREQGAVPFRSDPRARREAADPL